MGITKIKFVDFIKTRLQTSNKNDSLRSIGMHFVKPKFLLVVVLSLFSCSLLYSQTGKIAGRVISSETGEPVPFATVLVVDKQLGAASDIDGYYNIINVRPGEYNLKASAVGFQSVVIEGVRVSIDLTAKIDFELSETSIVLGQQLVVTAKKPLVINDLTASTANVGAKEIASLPITEFEDVLHLQAGFVGGTVRGGRAGEVVYAIDGVPITDVYNGTNIIDVGTSTIDELQFISGAFNAEYGKALSAYVNIVTKEADENFTASASSYFGSHISNHTNIFRGIDKFDVASIRNYEGTISGPIIKEVLSMFVHARYNYDGGWINGRRDYNPWDITYNLGSSYDVSDRYIISKTGDGQLVPMNFNEKVLLQSKITFKPSSNFKVNYNFLLDKNKFKLYDVVSDAHSFDLNPDGDYKRFQTGLTNILSIIHTLSSKSFYQANFSYVYNQYKHYVYEDYADSRYTNTMLLEQEPLEVPSLNTGGTQYHNYRRFTNTYGVKVDFTSQISQAHLIKIGFEYNRHTLHLCDATLIQPSNALNPEYTGNPFVQMSWPDANDPDEALAIDTYTRKPAEFSSYIQDKIELKDLVVNLGLRFDAFFPDGLLLNDPSDPNIYQPLKTENINRSLEERRTYWYKKPTNKYQLSPRLGIAFPITDRGVIHISYGHFFQIPNFQYLFANQEYKFGTGTGNLGVAGNPDIKPERSINGEIGLQQALMDDLSIEITGYFRDIRDLCGTRADEITMYGGSSRYSQYQNTDFAFIRGVVFSLNKRFGEGWSTSIDYTLQTAKGNASDPDAIRNQTVNGEEPEMQLISLDVDQTHTVNATFSYSSTDNWGFSVIGTYGSGLPYTPTSTKNISKLLTNSEKKPETYNVDLRVYKDFIFDHFRFNVFLKVTNLLDRLNQLLVYSDSGTANWTENEYSYRQDNLPALVNSLDEYYRNPAYYSEPRRIEFGVSVHFD